MRNLNSVFTSLRTALLCASAAVIFVGCGGDDKEQDPNPGTSQTTGSDGSNESSGSGDTGSKKALGETCAEAADCESNICREFSVADPTDDTKQITGKTCSACNGPEECTDAESGKLCAPALLNPVDAKTLHYRCSKGDLGDGCIDNSNCAEGRLCGSILGANITTCGECLTKDDCKDPAKPICSFKNEGTTGYRFCTNKLADGELCSGDEGSDDECENYCTKIELAGIPYKLAVCSPCKEDSHCPDGQKCTPPGGDISTLKPIPAKCEPKEDEGTTGEEGTTGTDSTTETSTDSTT